jgi:hypothetical protein
MPQTHSTDLVATTRNAGSHFGRVTETDVDVDLTDLGATLIVAGTGDLKIGLPPAAYQNTTGVNVAQTVTVRRGPDSTGTHTLRSVFGDSIEDPSTPGIYATDVTMPPEVMSVTYTVSKHGYWALTAKVAQ